MLNIARRFFYPTEQTRPPLPTLSELVELWLTKDRHGNKWRKEARRLLERNVLPTLGSRVVDAITTLDVSEVLESLRGDANYNNTRACIVRVYNWAHATGRLPKVVPNPAKDLPKRKLVPRENVLPDATLRLLWHESFTLGDFGNICRLILATGCRPGEIAALTWDHVRLDHPDGPVLYLPRTKNGKPHTVPLTPFAIAQLPDQRPGFPNLFGGIPGRAFNGFSMGRTLWDRRKLPCAPWTNHDLRRTVATRLGNLGVADDVIERILGHTAQGVTRRHYNHSQKIAHQREALERWAVELQRIAGLPTRSGGDTRQSDLGDGSLLPLAG